LPNVSGNRSATQISSVTQLHQQRTNVSSTSVTRRSVNQSSRMITISA